MKTADVVIGAGYGDEGKGLTTDYLAAQRGADTLVVRFNGGAQAGHTVQTPDGKRHVFSHLGSGSFVGARTYLSRFFVSNPWLYFKELDLLSSKGVKPVLLADPESPVTSPYDMMLNQFAEEARGQARHGSCGVGFGETIERHLRPEYAISMADLMDPLALAARLDRIRRYWLPERAAVLGIQDTASARYDLVMSDTLLESFVSDCQTFIGQVTLAGMDALASAEHVVFEGAQGLLLDQDRGAFPHVTRSNTGLKNVLVLAQEAGIRHLNVTYASRAYVTRHGAGPLANELGHIPYEGVVDPTNVPNDYQGSLRFSYLDLNQLEEAITCDVEDAAAYGHISVSKQLALSCLDQVGPSPRFYLNGALHSASPEGLVAAAAKHIQPLKTYVSRGPTRATMEVMTLQKSAA